jgi:hypothetical protein
MKNLMTALFLGALVAAPAFVPSANAQRMNGSESERARVMQECMAMNKRFNHDPYSATGGVQHHYRACMADHGQPE